MSKIAKGETFDNSMKLVEFINKNNITKEDIITVFPRYDFIVLVYYG